MLHFDVLTLFPDSFASFLQTSIIGRALNNNLFSVQTWDIRDFSSDKHRKVDDVPFGGGAGMVLMCQPVFAAVEHVKAQRPDSRVIFFTPHGENFSQPVAEHFANNATNLILLCGHYEGVDQRIRDCLVDQEISLGDFIVTGGELPAQIFMDAVVRLVPGVLGGDESVAEESFSAVLGRQTTEYPHYTRPAVFRDLSVPEVLLSGHHKNIADWRRDQCQNKQ